MEEAQSFQQVVLEQLNILKCEAHPKPHVLFRSEWNRDSKWIRDLNMEDYKTFETKTEGNIFRR